VNPLTLYQQRLDAVSQAALAGDFDAYADTIDLPYVIRTATGDHVLRTRDALLPGFRTVHDGLVRRGVTHYERVARQADYRQADRLDGRHYTHLIAGGVRVAAPWLAGHTLVRRGDRWLFSAAYYPSFTGNWPPTDAEIFEALAGDADSGTRDATFPTGEASQ
jgi:hypothetical protein